MRLGSQRQAVGVFGTASIEVVVYLDDILSGGRHQEVQERVEAVAVPIALEFPPRGVAEDQGGIHLGVDPLGQHFQDDALSLLGFEFEKVGGAFITEAVDRHSQRNRHGLGQRVIVVLREHLFPIPHHKGSSIGNPEVADHPQLIDSRRHIGGDGDLELARNRLWSWLKP